MAAAGLSRLRRKICVCVVEHNPLGARYLQQTLEHDPDVRVVSHEQLLKGSSRTGTEVGVCLIDRGTLPVALSEYLRSLRIRFPRAQMIVLDEPRPLEELCRLLFLGIQGLVPYGELEEHLGSAIRTVARGHFWVRPDVLEQYVRYSRRLSRLKEKEHGALTRREKDIVELLLRRLSNKEIASILRISESTVKFHLCNIFEKLGVHERAAVVEVLAARPVLQVLPEESG